tara:strand:- start:2691 stop:3137 length:447 start_codon:yes stop_codon:yes gene_type:complete
MARKKTYRKFKQGIFIPKNRKKFIGESAQYRSGLELKFFRFCDDNPNVVKWGSENVVIPYISPLDNKTHRYFVDNYVEIKEGSVITKYLIEIKPFSQTSAPTTKYRKKAHLLYEQKAFAVNTSKWRAAKEYCSKHRLKFLIITEKDLK